jgi:hypothetical protein
MLSTKNKTSVPDWSRNCSAKVRPVSATRARAPGGLVHLAINQRHLGLFELVDVDNAGFDELVVEVVALAGALTHTGEHRIARVHLGDVVDQFLNEHGLAHAGTAKEADLAALGIGREQVDHLDPGHKDQRFGRLVGEGRARAGGSRGARLR